MTKLTGRREGAIRRLTAEEMVTTSAPLQMYAFFPSPALSGESNPMIEIVPYLGGNLTLAIEEDGVSVAEAAAIPMRQNIRGLVCDLAGVTGVASHPLVRRQGRVAALVWQLLGQMRDQGCAVAAGYPFRPAFWSPFGVVGLPKLRTVTFPPRGLASLLKVEVPGEIQVCPVAEDYTTYSAFLHRVLDQCHGFAVLPEFRAVRLRDRNEMWLATVRTGGEVTGVMLYQIDGFNGDLVVDVLLTLDVWARAVLLRYLARHVDQVAQVTLPLAPDDVPELWASDLEATTESKVSFPGTPAPMARVLSLEALAGMPVGAGRLTVRVTDDPLLGGDYALDGTTGALEVSRGVREPDATLTPIGLSGLVYGVLDPDDVVVRGLGAVPGPAATQLRALFPRRMPFLTIVY